MVSSGTPVPVVKTGMSGRVRPETGRAHDRAREGCDGPRWELQAPIMAPGDVTTGAQVSTYDDIVGQRPVFTVAGPLEFQGKLYFP